MRWTDGEKGFQCGTRVIVGVSTKGSTKDKTTKEVNLDAEQNCAEILVEFKKASVCVLVV